MQKKKTKQPIEMEVIQGVAKEYIMWPYDTGSKKLILLVVVQN